MTKAELSDEQFRAIGKITVRFSLLELLVRLCVVKLLGTDNDRGTVVTAQMQFREVVDTFHRLYRRRFPMQEDQSSPEERGLMSAFREMIDRVDKAGEQRNLVVHCSWDPEGFTGRAIGQRWFKKGRDWFQPKFVTMTTDELNNIADQIGAVAEEVWSFYEELAVEAERERNRPR